MPSHSILTTIDEFGTSARVLPTDKASYSLVRPARVSPAWLWPSLVNSNLKFCSLSLAMAGVDDSSLQILIESLPSPCILVLEDIDSAGLDRETLKQDKKGKKRHIRPGVTLSGLLNALDGAAAPRGHILILTTNAPEALDPGLVRESRCDRTIDFKLADKEIARGIFKRMMHEAAADPDYLEDKAVEFANQIPEGAFSPARIQIYLLDHINNIDAAVTGAEEWVIKMRLQDVELAEKKDQAMGTLATSARSGSSKRMYVNTSFGGSKIKRGAFAYGQPIIHSSERHQMVFPNVDTEGSMYPESVLEDLGYKSEEESGSESESEWELDSNASSANDSDGEVLETEKRLPKH